jgi:hypothetical protein
MLHARLLEIADHDTATRLIMTERPSDRSRELLRGAFDTHIHVGPDVVERIIDDVSLARRFEQLGMDGFVLKSHYTSTAERASVVRAAVPGIQALGAIVLNRAVGGMNPLAVEIAAREGARTVWMPTVDSVNESHERDAPPGAKVPVWVRLQLDLREQGIEIETVPGGRHCSPSCDASAELGERRLVCAIEFLLDRQGAQGLRKHLDSPRARVADLPAGLDVPGNVELALAGEVTVVDHLVDRVVHVLELTVGQLDPGQALLRYAAQVVGSDPELGHMPRIDRETAVWLIGVLGEVERFDVGVERHELVRNRGGGVVRRILAERRELLGEPAELAAGAGDVADLDVVGIERGGGVEQQLAPLVGVCACGGAGLREEVGEELDLQVLKSGVVEDLLHLAQGALLTAPTQ